MSWLDGLANGLAACALAELTLNPIAVAIGTCTFVASCLCRCRQRGRHIHLNLFGHIIWHTCHSSFNRGLGVLSAVVWMY